MSDTISIWCKKITPIKIRLKMGDIILEADKIDSKKSSNSKILSADQGFSRPAEGWPRPKVTITARASILQQIWGTFPRKR